MVRTLAYLQPKTSKTALLVVYSIELLELSEFCNTELSISRCARGNIGYRSHRKSKLKSPSVLSTAISLDAQYPKY